MQIKNVKCNLTLVMNILSNYIIAIFFGIQTNISLEPPKNVHCVLWHYLNHCTSLTKTCDRWVNCIISTNLNNVVLNM